MNIVIKDKIIPPVHKNEYKFAIEFMIGDADGEIERVVFQKHDENLKPFIQFLQDCRKHPFYGGCDGYEDVENYSLFAEGLDWPYEPDGQGFICTFRNFEITYFDENGDEFNVEIE